MAEKHFYDTDGNKYLLVGKKTTKPTTKKKSKKKKKYEDEYDEDEYEVSPLKILGFTMMVMVVFEIVKAI